MQCCFFWSHTWSSRSPGELLLGKGQCRPSCFLSSLPHCFPAAGETLRARNTRFSSLSLLYSFFFLSLSGKCSLIQLLLCSTACSFRDASWCAAKCLQRSNCLQTFLDGASKHTAGCRTVAAVGQGMQEEHCRSQRSHHQGVFWLILEGRVTTPESRLPIRAHLCFDAGNACLLSC